MYLERRMVDGLPYYWAVSRRTRHEKGGVAKRQKQIYLGRLTGTELDQWIETLTRWRAEVDDEGRPLHKTKPDPAP